MRDSFQRITVAVREIVKRVNAPFVPRPVMFGMANPIKQRIAHVHVRMCEIDPSPQDMRAIGKLPRSHPAEQIEIFRHGSVAIGTGRPGMTQRTTELPDFFRRTTVNVSQSLLDQLFGILIDGFKIVGRIKQVVPLEAQPKDVFLDRIDVLYVFFRRIGVVKPKIALTAILDRQPKIQADRLGMADMKISVRLGRKSRVNSTSEPSRCVVRINEFTDEIGRWCIRLFRGHDDSFLLHLGIPRGRANPRKSPSVD